jgi:hypothetical protein
MNPIAVTATTGPLAAETFRAQCRAAAFLYAERKIDLHHAVDSLQADAVAGGLVAAIGQDAVQKIMADALPGAAGTAYNLPRLFERG